MPNEQKFYDAKTLRKLQLVELGILKDFIEICDENSLDYFIFYGTAIGVVRHKGFIPWDDDIDICMFRKDYEKFAEIVSQEKYAEKYELISAANSDDYLMPEGHWQLKGTKFIDKPSLDYKKVTLGIFLDLFILDNLADDPKDRQKQERDCFMWGKLMIVRSISHPIVPFGGVKGKLVSFMLFILHWLMVIFRISPRWLYRKYTEASTRFNNVKTEFVTNFRCLEIEETKLTHDEIYPLKQLPFEDTMVNVINEYERSLERLFGNYMELPPVEKRHNHCPEILDFGNSLEQFGIENAD